LGPLEIIFQDVERGLNAGLFYLALAVALTVPGVCAALESASGSTSGRDAIAFRDWYNANLAHMYPSLTADDCYSLRCGLVHQGRFGDPNRMQYARVLFTIPNAQRATFHNNILNDALNLDTITFCRDMINAARNWWNARAGDPIVQANAARLVSLRPNGLAPYMVGMPLIA
jgi:hypothetical protein